MARRVPAAEQLRNKVMVALNDDMFTTLSDEAEARDLSVSTVARIALLQGLPGIRTKRYAVKRQTTYAKRMKGEDQG